MDDVILSDSPNTADVPAPPFSFQNATIEVDRITAAVNLVHDRLFNHLPGSTVQDEWLTLQMVQERLHDLRDALEAADLEGRPQDNAVYRAVAQAVQP